MTFNIEKLEHIPTHGVTLEAIALLRQRPAIVTSRGKVKAVLVPVNEGEDLIEGLVQLVSMFRNQKEELAE